MRKGTLFIVMSLFFVFVFELNPVLASEKNKSYNQATKLNKVSQKASAKKHKKVTKKSRHLSQKQASNKSLKLKEFRLLKKGEFKRLSKLNQIIYLIAYREFVVQFANDLRQKGKKTALNQKKNHYSFFDFLICRLNAQSASAGLCMNNGIAIQLTEPCISPHYDFDTTEIASSFGITYNCGAGERPCSLVFGVDNENKGFCSPNNTNTCAEKSSRIGGSNVGSLSNLYKLRGECQSDSTTVDGVDCSKLRLIMDNPDTPNSFDQQISKAREFCSTRNNWNICQNGITKAQSAYNELAGSVSSPSKTGSSKLGIDCFTEAIEWSEKKRGNSDFKLNLRWKKLIELASNSNKCKEFGRDMRQLYQLFGYCGTKSEFALEQLPQEVSEPLSKRQNNNNIESLERRWTAYEAFLGLSNLDEEDKIFARSKAQEIKDEISRLRGLSIYLDLPDGSNDDLSNEFKNTFGVQPELVEELFCESLDAQAFAEKVLEKIGKVTTNAHLDFKACLSDSIGYKVTESGATNLAETYTEKSNFFRDQCQWVEWVNLDPSGLLRLVQSANSNDKQPVMMISSRNDNPNECFVIDRLDRDRLYFKSFSGEQRFTQLAEDSKVKAYTLSCEGGAGDQSIRKARENEPISPQRATQ